MSTEEATGGLDSHVRVQGMSLVHGSFRTQSKAEAVTASGVCQHDTQICGRLMDSKDKFEERPGEEGDIKWCLMRPKKRER